MTDLIERLVERALPLPAKHREPVLTPAPERAMRPHGAPVLIDPPLVRPYVGGLAR